MMHYHFFAKRLNQFFEKPLFQTQFLNEGLNILFGLNGYTGLIEFPGFEMRDRRARLEFGNESQGFEFKERVTAVTFAGTAEIVILGIGLIFGAFDEQSATQCVCQPAARIWETKLEGGGHVRLKPEIFPSPVQAGAGQVCV